MSRASLYYRPIPAPPEEVALKHRIDEIYTQWPFYGSRKITALLQREGQLVTRKAVQRHMREMGIAGITPGPNLSRRNSEQAVYPLPWVKDRKFWPAVGRIDNPYGDRNLFCSCPPIEQ